MLENKRVNMILSLVIAIALWAFVIGEVNPEATRVYREIPIQLVNEETLDESGLAVLSVSDAELSVTITGTRSQVNQVSEKDIIAIVDLSQAAIGENQLRIDVKVPSKVDIEAQSLNKITVVVEEKVSKDVEVRVSYNGSFEGEQEPITVEKSLEYVTVTGAASNVDRVAYVAAIAEEGSVKEALSTFDCGLAPVDRNGLQVSNVELMTNSIQVTAELAKTKSVPLIVPILEDDNAAVERTIAVPETITLKGRGTDLENIESVTAETIDLNNIMENTTIEIIPILPENVEVSSESEALITTVQVTKMQSKTFTLGADVIVLNNLGENLSSQVMTNEVEITIMGRADLVNHISEEDFSLSVNLAGLKTGTHRIALDVQCNVEAVMIEYKPQNVKVKIVQDGADSEEENKETNIDNENIEE